MEGGGGGGGGSTAWWHFAKVRLRHKRVVRTDGHGERDRIKSVYYNNRSCPGRRNIIIIIVRADRQANNIHFRRGR